MADGRIIEEGTPEILAATGGWYAGTFELQKMGWEDVACRRALDLPQGRISRHLAVLKHAGLVSDRRDGTWIYYSLTESSTGLGRKLHAYLESERDSLVTPYPQRLGELADAGKICIPHPR